MASVLSTLRRTSLKDLRRWLPDWEWRAEREGFGWIYVGANGDRRVEVRAYSVLGGYSDDDFETQWRAEEAGKPSTPLLLWQP